MWHGSGDVCAEEWRYPAAYVQKRTTETAETCAASPSINRLSRRQRQVFDLVVQGRSNKEIARTLNLGVGTVKIHMAGLFRKLGVHRRAAVAVAVAEGAFLQTAIGIDRRGIILGMQHGV
jgi:DNA-binding NarL/FixJ family response regulator